MDLAWSLCDRALVLDGGRIAADGPAHAILANAALLEAHGLELPFQARTGAPAEAPAPPSAGTIAQ
jgi:cobalt/nickel transport system ATP-binding protein